jgi:exodeoxyribonuclease VII large subunit
LQLAFRQLHQKLESEGLFNPDRKRPLPPYPRHIALITSPTGAAIRDFLQVLNRRWPGIRVTVIPVKVQGPGSAEQVAAADPLDSAFQRATGCRCFDARRGSIEDLWSFNEEIVCRAIFECEVPLVCGVGHEIDVTLADLTADVRALTPSEAAERIVPDRIGSQTAAAFATSVRLSSLLTRQTSRAPDHQLQSRCNEDPTITQPFRNLEPGNDQELDRLESQLERGIRLKFARRAGHVNPTSSRRSWQHTTPLSILARGYSMTSDEQGKLILSADDINAGETIVTRFREGQVTSIVSSKST